MDRRTQYSRSLGNRILHGAGALSLNPYRVDRTAIIPSVAHRRADDGRLLVMCPAAEALFLGDAEVRVDGTKKAPEALVDITVATFHGLGHVTWLEHDDAVISRSGFGPVPDAFIVGAVELDRLYVHGPCGVTKLDGRLPDVPEWTINGELEARDLVGTLSPSELSALLSDVLVEFAPGFPCSEFEVAPHAAAAAAEAGATERTWVADIDAGGVVLATMHHNRLTSVFAEFPAEAADLSDLAGTIADLAAHASVRHASPRI